MSSPGSSGVTLIEMMIVVALLGAMTAISFPAVTSGIDSLRLASATDAVASFLNAGLTLADRRQETIAVIIDPKAGQLWLRSAASPFERRLTLPEGIHIVRLHPAAPDAAEDAPRWFLLEPGGTVPGFGLELANQRGRRRIVRVDPITGVPQIDRPEEN